MDFNGKNLERRLFTKEPKHLCHTGLICCRGEGVRGPGGRQCVSAICQGLYTSSLQVSFMLSAFCFVFLGGPVEWGEVRYRSK